MTDVAGAVVSSIESHGQFLTTLSLATSGAVFAFLIQVVFHNSQSDRTPIKIRYPGILLWAIGLSCISILFWYALKSSLVAAIPAIYKLQWTGASTTKELREAELTSIPYLAAGQIVFFSLSILTLFIALLLNLSLLRGQAYPVQAKAALQTAATAQTRPPVQESPASKGEKKT